MATSSEIFSRDVLEEWKKRLGSLKVRRKHMNELVMDFLVAEDYVEVAEMFQLESGTELHLDVPTSADRITIKRAMQHGNVEDAIEKVNDFDPMILETNPRLYFHVHQQRLIELIRHGKIEEALELAQELAPKVQENQCRLEELERTLALLAFEDVRNCPVAELLNTSQRLETARELNADILSSQDLTQDPKLPMLLKALVWVQDRLAERISYPRIYDLATASFRRPSV